MSKYTAMDIAKWFIDRNEISVIFDGDDKMSLLKLLKLIYYAEGYSLAINHVSLFSEPIIAWEHGPVVENVWRYYHDTPYDLKAPENAKIINPESDPETDFVLEQVYQDYRWYSAWGLRNKTHMEEPWDKATNGGQTINTVISRDVMRDFFSKELSDEA